MSRPVRRVEAMIVSRSGGTSVRRSITSTSMPRSASFWAASRLVHDGPTPRHERDVRARPADRRLPERNPHVGQLWHLSTHDGLLEGADLLLASGLARKRRTERLSVHPLGLETHHRAVVVAGGQQQAVHVEAGGGHDHDEPGYGREVAIDRHGVVDGAPTERVRRHAKHELVGGIAQVAPAYRAQVHQPVEGVEAVVAELDLGECHEVRVEGEAGGRSDDQWLVER